MILAVLLLTWTVVAVLPSFAQAKKSSSGTMDKGSSSSGGSTSGGNDGSSSGSLGNTNVNDPQHPGKEDTKDISDIPEENGSHCLTNDCPKKPIDKNTPVCMIPEGCGKGIPNGTPMNQPENQPITPSHPDKGCAFHPESPKCHPDKDGNCPPGFSHNVHNNCFPSGKCPAGFSRHTDDETGKCFSNHRPHLHPHHKTIVIVKHTSSSSSSSSSHNLSNQCFNEIKIAWLGKIQRGDFKKVDSIIDKCLGVH